MLILLTLFGIVGAYLYLRRRRLRRLQARGGRGRVSSLDDEEERVPLATYDGETYRDEHGRVDRKGKGKARSTSFDDDDEDGDGDEQLQQRDSSDAGAGSRRGSHAGSRRASGSQTVFALGDEDDDK